jgi:plasmid stabilization system protein ParE
LHLIIRPDAEADIAAAYDWYEKQHEGLGREFVEEISAAIEAVQADPIRFPAIFRTLRRALVHRFPYGIFFIARGDAVIVVAAMHLARNPRRIHRRAKSDL